MNLKSILFFSCCLMGTSSLHADMSLTQKILKPVIQYQCETELNESKIWKVSTYLMTVEAKRQLKDDVCNCVSDHALNDVSTKDLIKATMSEDAKKLVAKQAVMNTLKSCVIASKL